MTTTPIAAGPNDVTVRTLPCPFCGRTNISHGEVLTKHKDGRTTTQSQCLNCGALGPEAKTDGPDYGSVLAIGAWNLRKVWAADDMVCVTPHEIRFGCKFAKVKPIVSAAKRLRTIMDNTPSNAELRGGDSRPA